VTDRPAVVGADLGPVLVVDDEITVRSVFVRTLEDAGYRTAQAEDGASALAATELERPSLVLLDITMPGMSGVEVVKAIRAGESGHAIPIILVTALADVVDRVRGLEAGANDYVAKPVALDELVARVAAQLRASRAWTEHQAAARIAAEHERARFINLTDVDSELDVTLREAADEASVFRGATRLLASIEGVALVSIALLEPAGLLRIHAIDGDAKRLAGLSTGVGDSVQPIPPSMEWALATGDAFVRAMDTQSDATIQGSLAVPGTASEAVIPIRAGEFTLGVLAVQTDDPEFFGEAELKLVGRAAVTVAARLREIERQERERALTNALEAERRESDRFASMTVAVDDALGAILRPDSLSIAACRLPVDLEVCSLAWFGFVQTDRRGQRLQVVASAGERENLAALIASIRRAPLAFVGEAALTMNRTAVLSDISRDSRFRHGARALLDSGMSSMVFVPIFVGLRLAAGLACYGTEAGAFGVREVALLERVGANVSHRLAAIESVRRLPRSREGIRTIARRANDDWTNVVGKRRERS
jgi:CheY-like chemotaxis protein